MPLRGIIDEQSFFIILITILYLLLPQDSDKLESYFFEFFIGLQVYKQILIVIGYTVSWSNW